MSKKTKPKTSVPSQILVGNKPAMSYALFSANQQKDAKEIVIKARGKSIHKAVDVAEILRRRFFSGLKVKKIEIGTIEVEDQKTKKQKKISTIEITVTK